MTRDMTRAQFLAALERNGFRKPIMFWVQSKDNPSISYGMFFDRNGKLRRRETLARVIQKRSSERAKAEGAS